MNFALAVSESTEHAVVRSAVASERQAVLDVITLAFAGDPLIRWAIPSPTVYDSVFPSWAGALGESGLAHGTVYVVNDVVGAALWLPPGVGPDMSRLVAIPGDVVHGQHYADFLQILAQLNACQPHEPCWFLPLVGIDPRFQGCGYGSLLMRHALQRCDADGSLAYLVSSNPRNVTLYQRHGFEIMRTIRAGGSPPVTPMLRYPSKIRGTRG